MNAIVQDFHDKLVASFPTGPDGKTPQYPDWFCWTMNKLDERVHFDNYECCWVAPYGFVAEGGCPLHD